MDRDKVSVVGLSAFLTVLLVSGCSNSGGAGSAAPSISTEPEVPTAVTQVCSVDDERLTEISGIAASTQHPGVLWVHNDSGDSARIFALDAQTCKTRAEVKLGGVDVVDPEAIAIGRDDDDQPVIWLADIGDNGKVRSSVSMIRIPEPTQIEDMTVEASTVKVTYADRARDAEAILVDPKPGGTIWIVTKSSRMGKFYQLPDVYGSSSVTAEPGIDAPALVTDGSYAPNGEFFSLRTYLDGEQRTAPPPGSGGQSLGIGFHGQGEALTYSANSTFFYFISEGENAPLKMAPLP